jgi:hypothetical protein
MLTRNPKTLPRYPKRSPGTPNAYQGRQNAHQVTQNATQPYAEADVPLLSAPAPGSMMGAVARLIGPRPPDLCRADKQTMPLDSTGRAASITLATLSATCADPRFLSFIGRNKRARGRRVSVYEEATDFRLGS